MTFLFCSFVSKFQFFLQFDFSKSFFSALLHYIDMFISKLEFPTTILLYTIVPGYLFLAAIPLKMLHVDQTSQSMKLTSTRTCHLDSWSFLYPGYCNIPVHLFMN